MDKQTAQKLVDKTRDDYNLIAEQFANTRKYNWPEVTRTLNDILNNFDKDKKIKVLDVGCGSGRVYDFFKGYNVDYHGIDISKELIKIAKKSYPEKDFRVGDATNLPYKDNEFDITFSIATIHHIPSKELRDRFNSELFRVTKHGGWTFVETWYFWNKRKIIFNIIANYLKRNLPLGDFYKPWKNSSGGLMTKRYFHAWSIGELKKSLKQAGFIDVSVYNFYRKTRNLNVIAQKPRK